MQSTINPTPFGHEDSVVLLAPGLLDAVSPEDLLAENHTKVPPPKWLRQLELPTSRNNIRCLNRRTRFAKRAGDVVLSLVLIIVSAPIAILAALAIKLSSRGPILFSQIRVGLNERNCLNADPTDQPCRRETPNYGRPFKIFKLRTMHLAADEGGPRQAQAGDSRIFAVGRLLRRMRIDELPQLFNVLRGEMSLVGPRPECIEYMEELNAKIPNYSQRLGLKPGLTGIAQIEAGYANDLDSYRRKVAYDLLYLQNCCLGNDLRIILRTCKVVLTGFGAL